jgi:hypothetical protein
MLYAIRWSDEHGVAWWLRPACFEGAEYRWAHEGMPARAMKLSTAADAAAVAASQSVPCEVVVVAPGHEYLDPPPGPAAPPAPDVPSVDLIRTFVILNGKAH